MATILPENQINQELNSSVHQFFREQKLGTLLNQSNISERSRHLTGTTGPVHLFIGPSKEKFISDIGIRTGARGSCQGCGLSLAQQRNL